VLDLHGRASRAVPLKLSSLSRLTQLENLQLNSIANEVEGGHLAAALRSLAQLTQLGVHLLYEDSDPFHWAEDDNRMIFPWTAAVCRLTNLHQLSVTADARPELKFESTIFRGLLPAALAKLTALRDITVLGMDTCEVQDDSSQQALQLTALPALEFAALQLHTRSDLFPGLGRQKQVIFSRLVSLSLGLRVGAEAGTYGSTYLPAIIAPALAELTLAGMWLAEHGGELVWLPCLPNLRRLVLKDLDTGSRELPEGIMACTGLTELVLDSVKVTISLPGSNPPGMEDQREVSNLPVAGPYLSKLVSLGLPRNGFSKVPPSLAAATALELLDFGDQILYVDEYTGILDGMSVLDGLPRLRGMNLTGFEASDARFDKFRAAHPHISLTY